MTKPPPEVVAFIEELREFTRPTLWRRASGLLVRSWWRLRSFLRRKPDYQPSIQKGMTLLLDGKEVMVKSVSGSTITLGDDSTLTTVNRL